MPIVRVKYDKLIDCLSNASGDTQLRASFMDACGHYGRDILADVNDKA